MTIQVYNTLTRQKEVFEPLIPGQVSFYVCGPTVYNYIHIGNARSAVAFDTIRRYLMYRGFTVNYVSNFTDVDDKIIKAAQVENTTPEAIAEKYIAAFKEDTKAIKVMPATVHPRVMENITEIIEFIQVLIEKGFAYQSEGDVYFKTQQFETYGKLSDTRPDGTMIVVEDGQYYMNEWLNVVVTSALQTSAGRMIFAKPVHSQGQIETND